VSKRKIEVEVPAEENCTEEQAAQFVGIDRTTWRRLARAGLIPGLVTRESGYWHWTVVLGVSLLLPHLLSKLPVKRNSGKKLEGTGG